MVDSLVDAVAVLQRRTLPLELLGKTVKVGKAPQQVLLARLPELRVAHEALHQVQPAANTTDEASGGETRRSGFKPSPLLNPGSVQQRLFDPLLDQPLALRRAALVQKSGQ